MSNRWKASWQQVIKRPPVTCQGVAYGYQKSQHTSLMSLPHTCVYHVNMSSLTSRTSIGSRNERDSWSRAWYWCCATNTLGIWTSDVSPTCCIKEALSKSNEWYVWVCVLTWCIHGDPAVVMFISDYSCNGTACLHGSNLVDKGALASLNQCNPVLTWRRHNIASITIIFMCRW